MQAFIAFAAQKFGINENTFYLCNVRINVLTIQVCFLRGQAVNVTTQFVKPYIKCAALVLSKTIHHHFQESLFEEKFTPYSWNQELTRVISWLELNRWFHSSGVFGGIAALYYSTALQIFFHCTPIFVGVHSKNDTTRPDSFWCDDATMRRLTS